MAALTTLKGEESGRSKKGGKAEIVKDLVVIITNKTSLLVEELRR